MYIRLFIRLIVVFAAFAQAVAQSIEVTSTGVGIGTATAGRKLEVNADLGVSAGEKFIANFTQLTGQNGLYVGYRANGSSVTSSLIRADNNLPITFGTSGATQAVTITNSGDVGIGTTSPSGALHIAMTSQEPAIKLGGVRFYDGVDGGVAGVSLLNFYSSVGNKQLILADSDQLGSSSIGSIRFSLGTAASIDVLTLSGHYGKDLSINGAITVQNGGNVGVGTATPSYKLEVSGSVRATSFIANSNTYADFVFKPGYKLASLSEVEAAIKAHGHLPDIPSEGEAKARGIDLAQMQVKLLQKVEELTLYLVAHEKKLQLLQERNETLERQVSELKKR